MNVSCSYQLSSACVIVVQVINTALLANRRSIARLRLHLLEEDLQKESVLRLRWQDVSKTWKTGRVQQEIERFWYVSRVVAVLCNTAHCLSLGEVSSRFRHRRITANQRLLLASNTFELDVTSRPVPLASEWNVPLVLYG